MGETHKPSNSVTGIKGRKMNMMMMMMMMIMMMMMMMMMMMTDRGCLVLKTVIAVCYRKIGDRSLEGYVE